MPEDLQHLLDTIEKEGVEKGKSEAQRIIDEAQQKADKIVEEAREKAEHTREESERQAKQAEERGRKALQQAARNVLISVGEGIEGVLRSSILEQVEDTLDAEFLKNVLDKMITSYFQDCAGTHRAIVFLSEEDRGKLVEFFMHKIREDSVEGLEMHAHSMVRKGFRVSLEDEDFYYDFTARAIADELAQYLRPELQEIVRKAAEEQTASEKQTNTPPDKEE